MDTEEEVDGKKYRYGLYLRKLHDKGFAACVLCNNSRINYANRGVGALRKHIQSAAHRQRVAAEKNNATIPGMLQL